MKHKIVKTAGEARQQLASGPSHPSLRPVKASLISYGLKKCKKSRPVFKPLYHGLGPIYTVLYTGGQTFEISHVDFAQGVFYVFCMLVF